MAIKPKGFWNGADLRKLQQMVNQLDTIAVKHEARLVKLEAGSLRSVVAAIKDLTKMQTRIAKAIENASINWGGMNSGDEQKAFEGFKARVETLKETGTK